MKKSNLITGFIYVTFSISCFIVQNIFETGLDSMLIGFPIYNRDYYLQTFK